MGPQSPAPDMFRPRLDEQINMKYPLVRLAGLIDWEEIHRSFAVHFSSGRGRPALSPRLVAGLLYLQHAFDASDEAVVGTWVENPYWQFFTGETYLQTELPIDPSSADALEEAHRRGRRRDAAGADHRGGTQGRDDQQDECGPRHRRHDRDAQGDCAPDRQPSA